MTGDSADKIRAAAARGQRMRELGDDLFAVFEAVERTYLEQLVTSRVEDAETREQIYHRTNALRDLRRAMEVVIAEGRGAEAMIRQMEKKSR